VLDQVTREVEIEVLPEHIPDRVELDVTALKIAMTPCTFHALTIANATILTSRGSDDRDVVVPPRAEEVAAPTPEATTDVAEPELIRKVRRDDEEGAEGEGEAKAEGKGEPAEGGEKPTGRGRQGPRAASPCALVVGLGNPVPSTRDAPQCASEASGSPMRWSRGGSCRPVFRRGERARVTSGEFAGVPLQVLKPTTFMNLSRRRRSHRCAPIRPSTRLLICWFLVDEFPHP